MRNGELFIESTPEYPLILGGDQSIGDTQAFVLVNLAFISS